jgi:hypothetical protein
MDENIMNTIWKVTTEGDCEGRSVQQLGLFTGEIDDIAFYLKDKSYYKLTFREETVGVKHIDHIVGKSGKVSVQVPKLSSFIASMKEKVDTGLDLKESRLYGETIELNWERNEKLLKKRSIIEQIEKLEKELREV